MKIKFYGFIIIMCFGISVVFGQSVQLSENINMNYNGKLGIESWYFPRKAPLKSYPEFVNTFSGQLDVVFQFDAPMEIRANQRFQVDPDDDNRNRYEIDDLYLDYFQDWFEIRAGLQIFSWKTIESISQADFLNQTDFESDFLDADKLSQLAVRGRYIFEGNDVMELYILPYMRPTRFPVENNRYSFGLNILNDPENHIYQSDQKEWRPQFALSYQTFLLDALDTRFFYFNGYNRFPGLIPIDASFSAFVHEYRLVDKAGFTFQGELDAWLLKGEFVYTSYQKKVQNQLGQMIKPAYFAYTTGFEHTLYSFIKDNQDLGIIVELIGDTDTGKKAEELESFRPFQNHVFGGLRYTFNNISDRSILAGGLIDYKSGDVILSAEYSERLLEVFTIKLTYNDLMADTSPLDSFKHTDRLIAELVYNF